MNRVKLIVIVVLAVSAVFATDYTWNGTTGTFQTDSNWSPTGVPGVADQAKFTTAGTYGVSFAGDAANRYVTVGASGGAAVTFDLAGYTWRLTNNLAFANTGAARFGGGTLEVGVPFQPYTAPTLTVAANQKLVLDSGTARLLGPVNVSSGGAFEVNGGDHMLAWSMGLNTPPAGVASFRMTGGRLTMTNNDNSARCSLWNGSRMSLEGGTLSVRYQVDINGIPSAPAVIDIYTNATLLQSPGIGFNVSRTAGGLGIVNILGGSLILSNSTFNVVNMNSTILPTTGMVNLVDGTLLTTTMNLGSTSNAVALVRQTGGRMLSMGDVYLGKERDTLGVLAQEGGTAWYNQLYVGGFAGRGGKGEVNLSGGTLAVTGGSSAVGKYAGSTGRLLQTGGDLILSNSFAVGNAAGAFGVVTNTGGSFWLNNTLNLGNSGAGAFGRAYFSGPSNYVKTAINVGTSTSDRGELIVAGGQLVSDGLVTVGNAAGSTGVVSVTGGTALFNGLVTVGSLAGSTGEVSITGGTALFKGLTIGQSGQGALFVSGGLLAVTNGGALLVGNAANAVGSVTISGGTNFFNGGQITIGQFGSGFMRLEGGYTYTTNRFVVGGGSNSIGRLELAGGILSAPIIDGRDTTLTNGNPGGYSEVLFDGGTLQHSVDAESWMRDQFVSWFAKATLTDRGAVIDSNGGMVTITQVLSNEVGYAGSFTKQGAGKVTLTAWYNAFTGRVTVEEGELAVSSGGGIYLTGGVAIDAGAILNLGGAGAVYGLATASGTVSRIDGALTLKAGTVLTNGLGAALGGGGVVTGSVAFATGSVCGRDKANGSGALQVTGSTVFQDGVTVALTGYTLNDLTAGIPLVTAVSSGTLQVSGKLPVTLNGASHPYWWAKASADGKTLSARVIQFGTLIRVM